MTDHAPPLREAERERLEAARNWIKGHFNDTPEERYAPLQGKLSVIDAILKNGWVKRDETWKLQALGIAFGDTLAQKLLLDWVTVDDEYGCDPALNWPGTSLYSYPMTAISKRIEQGEHVDVQQLFESACSKLIEMAASAATPNQTLINGVWGLPAPAGPGQRPGLQPTPAAPASTP